MTLTKEEKLERKRESMAAKAHADGIGTYTGKVATVYQRMVRAEAAATRGTARAVVGVHITEVFRRVGQVVCVTCGKVGPYKEFHAGHFVQGRRASVIFEPSNCHPQCVVCNKQMSGHRSNYMLWMRHVYGQEEIDRLERLDNESRRFTHEELVDLKIEYYSRLKIAKEQMKG